MNFPTPTFLEIAHCYNFYSHKPGGDMWWALACCDKQSGELLITGLPSSNKKWKKTWFVANDDWGKDVQLGGHSQSVHSVFNRLGVMASVDLLIFLFCLCSLLLSDYCVSAAVWERIPLEDISKAWYVSPSRRHVDVLLDDQNLCDIGFISMLSKVRKKAMERNLEKKRKLATGAKKRTTNKTKDVDPPKKKRQISTRPSL
ncbi:hypothetical protein LWI28_021813 [Acer negundo]|uniref:Uncharacterized protein n=1 Tax=Acer negundo TaxID=4023 RepID=A0AAD5NUM5_ACENE|nr:hypothetical protein LWI28_021813 [Acer negundo]